MDGIVGISTGVGIAIAFGVVMPILVASQRKKVGTIRDLLRERGAMTLDEITAELRTNVFAKGYLMQALDQLVRDGKLEKIEPPPETPRRRRFRETRYALVIADDQAA